VFNWSRTTHLNGSDETSAFSPKRISMGAPLLIPESRSDDGEMEGEEHEVRRRGGKGLGVFYISSLSSPLEVLYQ